jgi:predicted lactoylglutathione lyase
MRHIFVNVAVADLDASMAFFKTLGFEFNMQFTNDAAACLIIDENIHAMLITEAYFKTFTPKPLCDAKKSSEVLIALSCDSRTQVDTLAEKAVAAGGRIIRETNDHGFMYDRAFEDLDGHVWEMFYMDMTALPKA